MTVTSINEQMVAFLEVTITSLMKSPLIEVIVTSPINEQMVGANFAELYGPPYVLVEKEKLSFLILFKKYFVKSI